MYNLANHENSKLISLLADGLKINDAQIILEILQALSVILELDASCGLKGPESFAYKYEVEGGLDRLEDLQKHPNI